VFFADFENHSGDVFIKLNKDKGTGYVDKEESNYR